MLASSSHQADGDRTSVSRREAFAISGIGALLVPMLASGAADEVTSVIDGVEMKMFLDPQGMFAVEIPKRFFALRRSAKGDLPDDKTGSGRRGSSIFSAGDMAKAEVVAVERCVTA